MKIAISKSQWQEMGKKAGWMKKAEFNEWGTTEDRLNDLVDKAIHNPRAFKELLRDNPELCDSLSSTLDSQQLGYQGPEKALDPDGLDQ